MLDEVAPAGQYAPAGQDTQAELALMPTSAELVPAGHCCGAAGPAGQYQPAGQLTELDGEPAGQ